MVNFKTFCISSIFLLASTIVSFSQKVSFNEEKHAAAPDYALKDNWSALPFNKDVADAFKKYVLSAGGSEHPMTLYKKFRGQDPDVKALLRRAGLD